MSVPPAPPLEGGAGRETPAGGDLPFRELADSVPALIWMADATGSCIYLNRRWLSFTGRSLEEELGDGWRHGVHPEDLRRLIEAYRRAAGAGEGFTVEYRLRGADGGHRWVLDQGVPMAGPGGAYVGACVDITERRRALDELSRSRALLGTIIEAAPVGFALLDRQRRFLRVNGAMAEIDSLPANAHAGRSLEEVLPELPHEAHQAFRRVLETGEPVPDLEIAARAPGAEGPRHWLSSWYPVPLDEAEDEVGVGVFLADITERVRAQRGLRILNDVGEALDATLGVEERLERLGELLVPEIADLCTIDTLDGAGRPRLVACAHATPVGERILRDLRERSSLDADAPFGISQALRTGAPDFRPDISPEELDAYAASSSAGALLRALGPRSAIVVPLRARGRVLGALALAMAGSGRRYDGADLALARQLGRRTGMAVDNARLYEDQRHIAHTLQQSLLPPELPDIPGLEVAARYRPMGDGNEVGGDFYDLFPAGSSWIAVIGDICGKGADAAALTSLARHGIRAISRHDPPPSRVLSDLNEVIVRERGLDTRFSTALYARLIASGENLGLVAASAGHPLPLIRRAGGRVESLGRAGTLLGPFATVRVRDAATELGPGDVLVLYTDGVTEARRGPTIFGEARLAQVLSGLGGRSAEEVAAAIEEAVMDFQGGPLPDDLAVLVVRVPPAGASPGAPAR